MVCFAGDGCFMMASTELATIVRHRVPVIVVVVNNGAYGTIRMHQERRYPGHVVGTELVNPDFARFAELCGAFAVTIADRGELGDRLSAALAHRGPSLVHVRSDVALV